MKNYLLCSYQQNLSKSEFAEKGKISAAKTLNMQC